MFNSQEGNLGEGGLLVDSIADSTDDLMVFSDQQGLVARVHDEANDMHSVHVGKGLSDDFFEKHESIGIGFGEVIAENVEGDPLGFWLNHDNTI